MWAAYRLTEIAPGARIVLLEADICGGGPSGRNGGFATGWWDELPTLIERHGERGAVDIARSIDDGVDSLGSWSAEHGVDAWYLKAGSISASAAPAQDGGWEEAVAACAAAGEPAALVALSADEVPGAGAVAGASGRRVHAGCRDGPAGDPGPRIAPRPARARRRDPRGDDGHGTGRGATRLARVAWEPALGGRRQVAGRAAVIVAVSVPRRSGSGRRRRPATDRSWQARPSSRSMRGRRRGRRSGLGS